MPSARATPGSLHSVAFGEPSPSYLYRGLLKLIAGLRCGGFITSSLPTERAQHKFTPLKLWRVNFRHPACSQTPC